MLCYALHTLEYVEMMLLSVCAMRLHIQSSFVSNPYHWWSATTQEEFLFLSLEFDGDEIAYSSAFETRVRNCLSCTR
ncbi:hypothetical protein D3C80_2158820 [compost metagenome]